MFLPAWTPAIYIMLPHHNIYKPQISTQHNIYKAEIYLRPASQVPGHGQWSYGLHNPGDHDFLSHNNVTQHNGDTDCMGM